MNLYYFFKRSLQEINWTKHIFCGYSGNIDWAVRLQGEDFLRLQNHLGLWPDSFSQSLCKPEIDTFAELINYVIYFLHTNSGGEGDIKDPELMRAIMQFLPGQFSIGGTGAQAANFLAYLGLPQVSLHLPIYNAHFEKILHHRLRIYHNTPFYEEKFGKEVSASLSEIHCIFDYAPQTAYRIGNAVFQTRSSDRVILSHDRCNANISISESFKQELTRPHQEVSFLVSGFNSFRKIESLSRFLQENQTIIEQFRRIHPRSSVCVEEAHYWNREEERIKTVATTIYPAIDSLGMNAREFQAISYHLGFQNENLIQALHSMAQHFGLKRIGVHSGERCLVVSAYPVEQEILADSLGILLSGAKAHYGRFVRLEELEAFLEAFRSFTQTKRIDSPQPLGNGYRAFSLPTLKGIPIASALGLGDAFTAGLLVHL